MAISTSPYPCCPNNAPVPVPEPPDEGGEELREDGGLELREDGGIELREDE